MKLFGNSHGLATGAKRYVDALCEDDKYKSGVFYASPGGKTSGKVVDQAIKHDEFANETYQDNANEAIHSFLK